MKKLTDLAMWKALGYTSFKGGKGGLGGWKRDGRIFTPPPFYTQSLDAITSEIEARGLIWAVVKIDGEACAGVSVKTNPDGLMPGQAKASTAPLALCAALCAYLKEAPKEDR